MIRTLAVLIVLAAVQEQKVSKAVKDAQDKLVVNADDPAANLTVGKYLAFTVGDWEKGLPLLVKGQDKPLAQTATKDLEGAKTAAGKVEIGDLWVDAIKKAPKDRQTLVDRASKWYGDAWPDLDDFWKMKLRERLARLYASPAPQPVRQFPIPGWGGSGTDKVEMVSTRVHSGFYAAQLVLNRKGGLGEVWGNETFEIKPGKEGEFSAWVLTDGTDTLDDGFFLGLQDAAGKMIGQHSFTMPKDRPIWTRLSEKFPMPDGAVKGKVHILLASRKGTVLYDDFSLKVDGKECLVAGGFEK